MRRLNAVSIVLATTTWLAITVGTAPAQSDRQAPHVESTPAGRQPGLERELRGDVGAQSRISEIDKQIEQTWKTVEEIRQSAIRLRLAHAQLKDALENSDCSVADKMLQSLKRSQDGLSRLGSSLDEQCKGVDPRVQRQLAQACASERKTIDTESSTLAQQLDRVLGMCPELRKAR